MHTLVDLEINIDGYGGPRIHCDGTNLSLKVFNDGYNISNNTVYVPGGETLVRCNSIMMNASAWMTGGEWNTTLHSPGYDRFSKVIDGVPSADTIIKWAKALLA